MMTLRKVIQKNREEYIERSKLATPLADKFIEQLNNQDSLNFIHWSQQIFLGYHPDQPQWSAWRIIFLNWSIVKSSTKMKSFENKIERLLMLYRKNIDTTDLDEEMAKSATNALSEWDLKMYTRHGFDNTDEYAEPQLTLIAIVEIHRLQCLWGGERGKFSSDEILLLCQHGQLVIDKLKVWMPEGSVSCIDSLWNET